MTIDHITLLTGSSSLASINASRQSLKPSFTTNYNNTTLTIYNFTITSTKTDDSNGKTAFIEGTPKKSENSLDYTGSEEISSIESSFHTICPSTQNASALTTAHEMQESTRSHAFESPNLKFMSLLISSGDQYYSKYSIIEAYAVSSLEVSGTEMKNTNSSKGSTADQKSYIFALVFGVFGGFLVLGIAVMIFRNLYTKSKNRVKKIKKKKGGTV